MAAGGEELLALAERLGAGTYRPEPGSVFVTERPKHRQVHAAAYRDRVVHHLLHALVEPAFEPRFSAASFACRTGRGTHAAVAALQRWMWRLSRHGGVRVHALSMDVKNFFMSLHRPTLLELLRPTVLRLERSLGDRLEPGSVTPWELCQRIVLHDPTDKARRLGPPALFARVPPHKRLGALGLERGLPIGNLTSQFFANVYLSPLDHFIQRTLGLPAFVRYVDDFVVLHPDPERLALAQARIEAFLAERLRLGVRAKPLQPVSGGVDFVGYIVRPRYLLLLPRARVVRAFRDKLGRLEDELRPFEVGKGLRLGLPGLGAVRGPVRVHRLDEATSERARALWASYEGHLGRASAHRLRARLWSAHPAVAARFQRRGGVARRRYALTRPARSLRDQVAQLARGITPEGSSKRAVLLIQIGKFAELPFGGARFNLKPRRPEPTKRNHRRGARYGVLWRYAHRLIECVLGAGHPVAVALEEPELAGQVKRRRLAYLFEPIPPVSPNPEKVPL